MANAEDAAKLMSASAEIKALKMEVHQSQCEVTSFTKKVETSNDHQTLTSKALEQANFLLQGARALTNSWKLK